MIEKTLEKVMKCLLVIKKDKQGRMKMRLIHPLSWVWIAIAIPVLVIREMAPDVISFFKDETTLF